MFCDEGVFRIALDIYLDRHAEFHDLLPMLGGFHMAKIVLGAIGKYVNGCGLEDALIETNVFGKKTIQAVLGGTHYVRSLRGIQILFAAIQSIKWQAFWDLHDPKKYARELSSLDSLMNALHNKEKKQCAALYTNVSSNLQQLLNDFEKFSQMCTDRSEVCQYWDGIINLTHLLQNLISADREGDWDAHLQAVQDLLPVFRECDNINYLRYASWYLEKMRKLPSEHPDIYDQFKNNHMFVVKTEHGSFNSVAPDMKLEQSIQRFKKGAGGIIGQTNEVSFVLEWELAYHEVLAIVNCYAQINKMKGHSDSNIESSLDHHHELSGGYGKLFYMLVDSVKIYRGKDEPLQTFFP